MNYKTYTEEEAVQSYRLAKNPEEQIKILSQILCGSEGEVKDMLRARGCDLPGEEPQKREYNKWTEEDITIAKARFNEGASCADIAHELGRTDKCVQMKLKSLGLSFRERKAEKRTVGHPHPSAASGRHLPLREGEGYVSADEGDKYDELGCRSFTVKEAAEEMERLSEINEQWRRAAEKLECDTPKELEVRISEMLLCLGGLTLENQRQKERTERILVKIEDVIRFERETV